MTNQVGNRNCHIFLITCARFMNEKSNGKILASCESFALIAKCRPPGANLWVIKCESSCVVHCSAYSLKLRLWLCEGVTHFLGQGSALEQVVARHKQVFSISRLCRLSVAAAFISMCLLQRKIVTSESYPELKRPKSIIENECPFQ